MVGVGTGVTVTTWETLFTHPFAFVTAHTYVPEVVAVIACVVCPPGVHE